MNEIEAVSYVFKIDTVLFNVQYLINSLIKPWSNTRPLLLRPKTIMTSIRYFHIFVPEILARLVAYLNVNDGCELAGLLQVVEAAVLHELAHNLVRDLVAPLVDHRHVDVVDEDGHALAGGRTVGCAHALVHVALDDVLFNCLYCFIHV